MGVLFDMEELQRRLRAMAGASYPAYKRLKGRYAFDGFALCIDHVQGDPFASPSRLRVVVPLVELDLPELALANRVRRIALRDYFAREACAVVRR